MNHELSDLIDSDDKYRWRIIISSIVFAAGCGFVAEQSGCRLVTAQIIATVAGISIAVGMTMKYLRTPVRRRERRIPVSKLQNWPRPLIGAALLIILVFSSSEIRALILTLRLRSVIAAEQSPVQAAKADYILRLAAKSNVRLRPELVSVAKAQAARLNDPNVWSDYISSVNNTIRMRSPDSTYPIVRGDSLDHHGIEAIMSNNIFANEAVSYHGGSVSLDHVCFYNVRFDIVDNENGRELAHELLSSKDNCVTISLP